MKKVNKYLAWGISLIIVTFMSWNVYKEKEILRLLCVYSNEIEPENCQNSITIEDYPQRYLSIGFDDFRSSDWSTVFPIFEQYGYTTTYNRIARDTTLSSIDRALMDVIIHTGNEVGDHTWFHVNYIYNDPLFNGQDPNELEGIQQIYPTNEQMRADRGDGKNSFGFDLREKVTDYFEVPNGIETVWGELSDEECQTIRESFSIYKDKTGLLDTLDKLSNRYLGTKGSSYGSWNKNTKMYEGGIFSGSKTSCNHEIWERILEITKCFYRDQYSREFAFTTWSWPGGARSPFGYENNGRYFYDEECKLLKNYTAQFPSSMNTDTNGEPIMRSWIQLLRQAGYRVSHDIVYPSREDGVSIPMMSKQLILNAKFSRKDALTYSTNRTVHYLDIAKDYPESFFDTISMKSRATQMYDDGGIYYTFIEELRKNTSNGMIHGEVIDSQDTYSEKIFLQSVLDYCKATGVEVISHKEAYDICFNQTNIEGNLIYNPMLRNTAKEFLPDAKNVPNNPDGYTGDCYVKYGVGNGNVLVTNSTTNYLHYGIPIGKIKYSANIEGVGDLKIYAIKNSDNVELRDEELELLGECKITAGGFYPVEFVIPDNPETVYDQICEGLGNKVMGIKIVYSGGLEIKDIELRLIDSCI